MVVDAAAASGQRGVDLAKDAWSLHDLPTVVSGVRHDAQRIQAMRKASVQDAEFGGFLIGDGDLRQMTAVRASATPTQVWMAAVLGTTMASQGTDARLY